MEFHISRQARDRYQFDQMIFSTNGNVIFADFHAARVFAQKMNQRRDLVTFPEQAVRAGQINAMGLIDEILHFVIDLYRRQRNSKVMEEALQVLYERLGEETVYKTLLEFTRQFPPLMVYRHEITPENYLDGNTDNVPNSALVLEEMLLLWITNRNPAMQSYNDLFDDRTLQTDTAYLITLRELAIFFENQHPFGPDQQNLIEMLCAPAVAVPNSLNGQLDYIRERWAELLGRYLYRLLSSLDLLKEEEKTIFLGSGPVLIPLYDRLAGAGELENFSQDREWMPRVVLIAKNSYVWLDQLTKKYLRPIHRLDQIPDEELDILARWGFTGLWLIGLWERSRASAQIKQLCGNPEAIASAYSLASYSIASELGGEEAYQNLRERAAQRGIRLASDMVPNHMGIDSDWVLYHPERFISTNYSPFPSYSFNGPDLSPDGRIGLYLDDHYFSRDDAAVVFKRVDRNTGQEMYIYHGNDGTTMPWNDTAQLNYLNAEVREAVIQTILHVARQFPIIRFDAAMTLAKRHYQRLWFPEPGSGGDIPSRAEHGLTKAQFDALMPIEFWREVVDRAAIEAPDTLLLAEAFWLMESYFVRTLGMHRVYNSAFMNLLRNEDNAKYRLLMKNTLEFDPEILKRFVNFMNNPDERTAVDQFGKGDKYFGICVLMSTLPGLPMFGHGQVEGLAEKYGMEFRRAYWDETEDRNLVERHEKEIFPLLHRRTVFSGVENFLLYDFYTPSGTVDENVFAYSNSQGGDYGLVVVHNKFSSTQGWVRTSVGYNAKIGDSHVMRQGNLGEALRLHNDPNAFVLYRDVIRGVEYIQPSVKFIEQGLFLELNAYQYNVFLDFREIQDTPFHTYYQLYEYLNGRGVPNIQEAMQELLLQPVQGPFRQIVNTGYLNYLFANTQSRDKTLLPDYIFDEAWEKFDSLLFGITAKTGKSYDRDEIQARLRARMQLIFDLPIIGSRYPLPNSHTYPEALAFLHHGLEKHPEWWHVIFSWTFFQDIGRVIEEDDPSGRCLSWLSEWQLNRILNETYRSLNIQGNNPPRLTQIGQILIGQQGWYLKFGQKSIKQILEQWLADDLVRNFLGVNRYKDVLWFNQEAFEDFVWWMALLGILEQPSNNPPSSAQYVEQILTNYDIACQLLDAAAVSDYQVKKLVEAAF